MSYQVKVEKVIGRPVSDVFRALKEGRLFMNCSADSSSMKIDFRVGGKYHIDFWSHGKFNYGEFLEIVPERKIVFSWCQSFEPDRQPDTQVTIELFPEASKTRLVLLHTGFRNQEICDAHQHGWMHGVDDFSNELQQGRLRMVRIYQAPVDEMFAICKNPATFFAFMGDVSRGVVDYKAGGKFQVPNEHGGIAGEFLDIVANKKISFSWLRGCTGPLSNSKVWLTFSSTDKGEARIELIHDGLTTEKDLAAHRHGWESVFQNLREVVVKAVKVA